MTDLQLISSNLSNRKIAVVRLERIPGNPKLSEFVCLDGHFAPLRKANAILIDVENKLALLAAFKMRDPMCIFIPNICIDADPKMRPEMDIFANTSADGPQTRSRGLYSEQFVRWQDARHIVRAGIKLFLFREGYTDRDTMDLFEKNGIKVVRVDI